MKKLTVSLFFAVLLALGCSANEGVNGNRVETTATVGSNGAAAKKTSPVKNVDSQAKFPGGDAELGDFIIKNLNYPISAFENGIQGTVMVKFVIDKEGKIEHKSIKVENSVNSDLAAEAIRVVKLLPDFTPAQLDGKDVDSWYVMPIMFRSKSQR